MPSFQPHPRPLPQGSVYAPQSFGEGSLTWGLYTLPEGGLFCKRPHIFRGFSPLPKALGRVDTALREGPGVGLKMVHN